MDPKAVRGFDFFGGALRDMRKVLGGLNQIILSSPDQVRNKEYKGGGTGGTEDDLAIN